MQILILLIAVLNFLFELQADIDHPSLADLIQPIKELFDHVKRKALMRLEYEGLHKTEAITAVGNRCVPWALTSYPLSPVRNTSIALFIR